MNYSKAIKLIRASRGLTQKDLATNSKLDPSFISLVECGKRTPSMHVLEVLSKALNVPFYLLALLASEKEDLKGLDPDQANILGKQLLNIVIHAHTK
jgi:transcriptional regulator with XRE-family HTH domain